MIVMNDRWRGHASKWTRSIYSELTARSKILVPNQKNFASGLPVIRHYIFNWFQGSCHTKNDWINSPLHIFLGSHYLKVLVPFSPLRKGRREAGSHNCISIWRFYTFSRATKQFWILLLPGIVTFWLISSTDINYLGLSSLIVTSLVLYYFIQECIQKKQMSLRSFCKTKENEKG